MGFALLASGGQLSAFLVIYKNLLFSTKNHRPMPDSRKPNYSLFSDFTGFINAALML
jgi:hypothetical protein